MAPLWLLLLRLRVGVMPIAKSGADQSAWMGYPVVLLPKTAVIEGVTRSHENAHRSWEMLTR